MGLCPAHWLWVEWSPMITSIKTGEPSKWFKLFSLIIYRINKFIMILVVVLFETNDLKMCSARWDGIVNSGKRPVTTNTITTLDWGPTIMAILLVLKCHHPIIMLGKQSSAIIDISRVKFSTKLYVFSCLQRSSESYQPFERVQRQCHLWPAWLQQPIRFYVFERLGPIWSWNHHRIVDGFSKNKMLTKS